MAITNRKTYLALTGLPTYELAKSGELREAGGCTWLVIDLREGFCLEVDVFRLMMMMIINSGVQ